MYSGNLCAALASCSATIWNERARAERVKLTRLETSDTELIVQNLTESLESTNLRADLRVFPPKEEADKGADLEIWLGLTDGLNIGFTIQAKRTTFSVTRLLTADSILQSSGTSGRNSRQLDDLIEHGKKVEANPVHLLYSGWNNSLTTDPLVRGRGTPTQYGASILPTWWFRESLKWPAMGGAGKKRVDLLSEIILPFEWLLKPEDIRQGWPRSRRSPSWFSTQYSNSMSSARTNQIIPNFFPFNRQCFRKVKSLVTSGLGISAPCDELVDYAVLGISLGSAEYGPTASTTLQDLKEPFDFGLSRKPPAYVPGVKLGSANTSDEQANDRTPLHERNPTGEGEDDTNEQGDDVRAFDSSQIFDSHQSRVSVDVVSDPDAMVEWQRRSGVETIPRTVLFIR